VKNSKALTTPVGRIVNWETSSKQTCRYIYKLVGLSCRHQRKAQQRMLKNASLARPLQVKKQEKEGEEGEKSSSSSKLPRNRELLSVRWLCAASSRAGWMDGWMDLPPND